MNVSLLEFWFDRNSVLEFEISILTINNNSLLKISKWDNNVRSQNKWDINLFFFIK